VYAPEHEGRWEGSPIEERQNDGKEGFVGGILRQEVNEERT
jgi:hypothetical protein